MGGVEFNLGTINMCQETHVEEQWARHKDVHEIDDLQNAKDVHKIDAVHNNKDVQEIDDVYNIIGMHEIDDVEQQNDNEVEIFKQDVEQIPEWYATGKSQKIVKNA